MCIHHFNRFCAILGGGIFTPFFPGNDSTFFLDGGKAIRKAYHSKGQTGSKNGIKSGFFEYGAAYVRSEHGADVVSPVQDAKPGRPLVKAGDVSHERVDAEVVDDEVPAQLVDVLHVQRLKRELIKELDVDDQRQRGDSLGKDRVTKFACLKFEPYSF